jgi:DNA modification methylase
MTATNLWVKDPAWANSRWSSNSYCAVDDFEYVYVFWKPGVTKVDRDRLTRTEWGEWDSRGTWQIPSVRKNDAHEAMFPLELPRRCIRLLTGPRRCRARLLRRRRNHSARSTRT